MGSVISVRMWSVVFSWREGTGVSEEEKCEGESKCSVELKQVIIWKIQGKASGGEIRIQLVHTKT